MEVNRWTGVSLVFSLASWMILGCGRERSTQNERLSGKPAAGAEQSALSATNRQSVSGERDATSTIDTARSHAAIAQDENKSESYDPSTDPSAIRVVFRSESESPDASLDEFLADLFLTDPRGRCTGVDPSTGRSLEEITNASYYDEAIEEVESEEEGTSWRVLEVMGPAAGSYRLTVHGTGKGSYDLSIAGHDAEMRPSGREFTGIQIDAGVVHSYALDFDKTSDAGVRAGGGYDGGGNEPPGANRLLSYASITQERTSFPRGTTTVALLVVYGEAIDPTTFRASLGGADLSALFSPAPRASQLVSIPIQAGETVLVLSVEGSLSTGAPKVKDTDSLSFVIEN